MRSLRYITIILTLVLNAIFVEAKTNILGPFNSIYDNNQAVDQMKNKQVALAQQNLLKSLKQNPKNGIARLNLGVNFVLLDEFDKALKEFQIIDKDPSASPELKFLARYNTGRVYQEKKEVDQALKAYQAALDLHADSIETKANIELMLQQQEGKGKGSGKDPQQDPNQDGEGSGKDQQKDQGKNGDDENKNKPQPQKGPQELSEKDIEKILEELKNQEQKIRSMEYGNQAKENQGGKTW